MPGTIRLMVGLLIVFGAIGTIEVDPNASLIGMIALASVGLYVMFSGVKAMK
jgi:hypothetical protein